MNASVCREDRTLIRNHNVRGDKNEGCKDLFKSVAALHIDSMLI